MYYNKKVSLITLPLSLYLSISSSLLLQTLGHLLRSDVTTLLSFLSFALSRLTTRAGTVTPPRIRGISFVLLSPHSPPPGLLSLSPSFWQYSHDSTCYRSSPSPSCSSSSSSRPQQQEAIAGLELSSTRSRPGGNFDLASAGLAAETPTGGSCCWPRLAVAGLREALLGKPPSAPVAIIPPMDEVSHSRASQGTKEKPVIAGR